MHNFLTAAKNPLAINDLYVIVLGIGTVFVGLICIILLCKILGVCCKILAKKDNADNSISSPINTPAATVAASTPAVIPNRRETVAAIAAAIAEDLGTDVSAIRILSIEKL